MLKFLQSRSTPTNKTLYVTGNQSADMDSCCSAILTSFFLDQTTTGYDQVRPCIDIPRSDLRLRADISWLFDKLQIPLDTILFSDDKWQSPENSLFLVDHNSPTLPGKVVGIIDHHQPEGAAIDCDPSVIEMVGSCVSLVIQHFKQLPGWNDPVAAALGIFPITNDTNNLKNKNKTTPTDVESYNFVKPYVTIDVDTTAKLLKAEKSNIKSFSAQDIFRKDCKLWSDIGISSVPLLLEEALAMWPDFAQQMSDFKKENNLTEYIVLASGKRDKQHVRELASVGRNAGLEAAPELQLKLRLEADGVYFYEQGNSDANRKVVAPIIRKLAGQI